MREWEQNIPSSEHHDIALQLRPILELEPFLREPLNVPIWLQLDFAVDEVLARSNICQYTTSQSVHGAGVDLKPLKPCERTEVIPACPLPHIYQEPRVALSHGGLEPDLR